EGEIVLRDDENARSLDWDRRTEPQRTVPVPAPPPVAVRAPEPAGERSSPGRSRRREDRNWNVKLAQSKVQQILEEAQTLGDAAIEEGSSADLEALGTAARYTSKEELARRAYLAQRRRFPNGARATQAGYFLGRIEESAGRPAKALEWFDGYLHEAPSEQF